MTRRATPERIALAAAVAITTVAGLALAARGGYSPDEELTFFIVQGIRDAGVPALPSGLAYWRGPLFSYAAWAAGAVLGFTFESYRLVSIVASAVTVVCVFAIARRLSGVGAAAALLLAAMPAFVAVTAYARFYSPLIAALTATLYVVVAGRSIWVFAALALTARGFHELGVTAILVPLACALAGTPMHRSFRRVTNLIVVTIVLVATHLLLAMLQRRGIGGEAAAAPWAWLGAPVPLLHTAPLLPTATLADWIAIAGLFGCASWWLARRLEPVDMVFVIAGAACASVLSLGTIVALGVLWLIVRPHGWRQHIAITTVLAAAGGLAWVVIMALRTDTLVSQEFVVGLFLTGLRAHLDGGRVLAEQLPVATALCALAMVPAAGMGTPSAVRAVAALLWLQTIMLGIFGIDVRTRFLAVMSPAIAILATVGMERVAAALRTPAASVNRFAITFAIAVLLPALVIEQQRMVRELLDRPLTTQWWSAWAPPAGLARTSDAGLARAIAADVVVTNDELAALMLAGRADHWWAPDDDTAAFYGRRRDGGLHGIYGGLPAIVGEPALEALATGSERGTSVIWFNSSKFGGVPAGLHEMASWPAGTIFQLTPDWFLVRMPPISSPR